MLINQLRHLIDKERLSSIPLFYNQYTWFNRIRWFMTLLNGHSLVKVSNYSETTREVTPPDWIKVITILHLCEGEWHHTLHIYTQSTLYIHKINYEFKARCKKWIKILVLNIIFKHYAYHIYLFYVIINTYLS